MKVLFAGHEVVKELLPMNECIEVMDEMFRTLASGDAVLPLRQAVWQPDKKGLLGVMPAYLGHPKVIGGKVITFFPGNSGTRFESHQGTVLLFDTENGRLLAAMDATTITNIRTAAASAVATRALARKDAHRLAILGSGTQASTHLSSMQLVREIDEVRVWSRNAEHARRFVQTATADGNAKVAFAESAERAVRDADLICTTTAATEPILRGEWIALGAHVNAIGSSVPPFRELDSEALVRSSLFTDRRQSLLDESNDFQVPLKEGRITVEHLRGEIGDVLVGKIDGRTNSEEITLFKSLGIAVEDLASAHHVFTKASQRNLGTWLDFSGEREPTG
ncbi:MAG TPA: ornithine cyclodeaminase family protein [Nitrososphaerales archaeon]|nr:ornithine cyclodeaminase family protein [Nitrososphaerales archaeon]